MMISFVQMMYIDPSVVSSAAVLFGSIAIGAGTALVIFYRRAKKKVAKVLHIDENAGKEVEDELVINDDETQN